MKRDITRKMDEVELSIQEQFKHLYCKKDFEETLKRIRTARKDRYSFLLKKLVEMIKDVSGTCEEGRPLEYYEELVEALSIPEDTDEINKRLISALCSSYTYYPRPGDFMRRIVDSLDPDTALSASLRLRLLRRFLATVNVKENRKYYSKALASLPTAELDETIFRAMNADTKEKCDYLNLLQGCHNLAEGNFVSPTMTKELLFLFAFAYNMRYYPDEDAVGYEVARDVKKNLFADYYSDNLTRYLYTVSGGKSGTSDVEPSGIGLNPKNFIDVVFVYYLNRESLEPKQKVARFFTTLNRIKELWKERHVYSEEERSYFEGLPTRLYQSRLEDKIRFLSEEDLVEYVLCNYYCDVRYTYAGKQDGAPQEGIRGVFELKFSTNTAYAQYEYIIESIKLALGLPSHTDFGKLDRRVLKEGTEAALAGSCTEAESLAMRVSELEGNVPEATPDYLRAMGVPEEHIERFSLVLKGIAKRLNPYDVIRVPDATAITRTKLIAAYYHQYCLENDSGLVAGGESPWRSFGTVYDDMCYCLDPFLEEAGYQCISTKNLYDVFVIFLAYCKINNFLT